MGHTYYTNSKGDLLQKITMADVKPDQWYKWGFYSRKWLITNNPTAKYFDQNGETFTLDSSIGLIEITEEKMNSLKNIRGWNDVY